MNDFFTQNIPAIVSFAVVAAALAGAAFARRELRKTLLFVAGALLLTGMAAVRLPGRSGPGAFFDDQGKPFFPAFTDPLACTGIEVVGFDAATAAPATFEVKLDPAGKGWVIPSHHNYPADAKDRLKNTATGVIGLTKDTIRSDNPADHKALGVLDPKESKSVGTEGLGKRIILTNKSDETLADLIIGKEVPDRPGQRFVRVPGKNRTYGVNLTLDLSTKFADWIETNLLKLDSSRVRRLVFDHDKIDLRRRPPLVPGEKVAIDRTEAGAGWTTEGLKPGEEVNPDKVRDVTTALADLKIVGVRPKPEGLSKDLKVAKDVREVIEKGIEKGAAGDLGSLVARGFFPTSDGRLLSTQGEIRVGTDEGAVYTLRFGEVTFASGDSLSSGADEAAAKAKASAADPKEPEGGVESRYLLVTVGFDPDLIPTPKPEPKPELPADVFAFDPNNTKQVAARAAEKAKADREREDHERKVVDGRKRVDELTDRFAAWYYVVPGEAFRGVNLDRAALVRPRSANPSPSGGFPGLPPGFGGPGGLPPGLGGGLPPGHP
ncbi:MAG TPA: DUF4340 domain-containing protein [Isosphaeraceae bacterium]|jgi:hypothetical protein|nr:DUF4340 domain-containing protein [Isosphaeraceae bacterium]